MLYSDILIKNFIAINDDPKDIANKLILKSCEVESIHSRTIPQDLVIGKIITVEKHPDADKLVVCTIDCGPKGIVTICTGATNTKVKQYVPVALDGCYLPAIDLKIKERPMRGIPSQGMICAKEELGIKEDLELHGIWDLSLDIIDINDQHLGVALVALCPWLNNTTYDIENKTITHRPDLAGHFGIANELYTIYKYEEPSKIKLHSMQTFHDRYSNKSILQLLTNGKQHTREIIVQTDGLRSYLLLSLKNIKVQQSQFFQRLNLLDIGMQAINNRVDIGNIFMALTGQPLHVFDADTIQGDIIVRNAINNEEFIDLIGKTHILTNQDIVIADGSKILALAGIIGGKSSAVHTGTKNILIEIANFDQVTIRSTSKRLGIRTDASMRFEKNINPAYSIQTFEFFMDLLAKYSDQLGYTYDGSSYFIDDTTYGQLMSPQTIDISLAKLHNLMYGSPTPIHQDIFTPIMNSLGFVVRPTDNADILRIIVPHRRATTDISIPEDIYEEFTRIFGFTNIVNPDKSMKLQLHKKDPFVEHYTQLVDIVYKELAYTQIETYPWIHDDEIKNFGLSPHQHFQLKNPLQPENTYLRDSLLHSLIPHIRMNHKFFDNIRMYDIGQIWDTTKDIKDMKNFSFDQSQTTSINTHEKTHIGLLHYKKHIGSRQEDSFLETKGHITYILEKLGCKYIYKKTDMAHFHPKKQIDVFVQSKGKELLVGHIGQLHPIISAKYKLPQQSQTSFAYLDLSLLSTIILEHTSDKQEYFTLQDQLITRDVSFVVDISDDFDKIINVFTKHKDIIHYNIFDIYTGASIGIDKKSISISYTIQGNGHSTNEEINNIMNNIIKEVNNVGGKLRE